VTERRVIGDDYDAELPVDIIALDRRLRDARPAPSRVFALRLHAEFEAIPSPAAKPPLGPLIAAFTTAGVLLLVLGALVTFL
jgi:hypothetical protein